MSNDGILAAVDLGLNSFHMIVTHFSEGNIQVVDRSRAGLDEHYCLSKEAQ